MTELIYICLIFNNFQLLKATPPVYIKIKMYSHILARNISVSCRSSSRLGLFDRSVI